MSKRPAIVSEPINYILPEDKELPKEEQTTYRIKSLSNKALEEITASIELSQKTDGAVSVLGSQLSEVIAFRRGCVGFTQYFIGEEKFDFVGESTPQADGYKRCSEADLEIIHLAHQRAVGKEILRISSLSKESKNS